jgi:hypothetical protein
MKTDKNIETITRIASDIAARYGSDHIDVIKDDTTNDFAILYHSENNSFQITDDKGENILDGIKFDDTILSDLEKELDKVSIGHCW